MKYFFSFFVVFSFFLGISCVSFASEHEVQIDRMMDASKLNIELFSSFQNALINQQIPTQEIPEQKREKFNEEFLRAAKTSFDPEVIRSYVRSKLLEHVSLEEAEAVIIFYESDFGRKIAALEDAAYSTEFRFTIIQKSQEILEKLESEPERKRIITELLSGLDTVEQNVTTTMFLLKGMLNGMIGANMLPNNLSEEQLDGIIAQQTANINAEATKSAYVIFYSVYASLSDEELAAYSQKLQTVEFVALYDTFTQSFREILSNEMESFSRNLFAGLGMERI